MKQDLVEQLVALRKGASLRQADLADKLGVSPGSIGLYESRARRVPLTMASKWAEACGSHLHVLVYQDEAELEASLSPKERVVLHQLRVLTEPERAVVDSVLRLLVNGDEPLKRVFAKQLQSLVEELPTNKT